MSIETIRYLRERAARDPAFQHQLETAPLAALQDYDLTDDERRELVLPNFSWFVEGTLAGCSRPRTSDAFATLKALGVRALVSVTVGPLPVDVLAAADLPAEHYSVEDAPTIMQVEQAIASIDRFIARGQPVAVHCDAGRGRTGCILACYLVAQGMAAAEAIAAVRARRPGSIELPAQEEIVAEYAQARHERQGS